MSLKGRRDEDQPFPVKDESSANNNNRQFFPVDMICGIGPCHPLFLQGCVRMGCFVGVYSICGLMTSVLSMYIVSQITTIEKQFGFSSSQSGFLLSCNDIGFLLTTVFFSYLARKVHIPRILWLCTVLYGIAGTTCSMSFFIAKDHIEEQATMLFAGSDANTSIQFNHSASRPSSRAPMCVFTSGYSRSQNMNGSLCDLEASNKDFGVGIPNKFSNTALILIAIGMMIQGLAKAPRYPFLTTYVDDNGKKKNTAMFMGIVSGVGIFGPAIAFSVGGLFSRQYVTLDDVPIVPRHPAWIGAWWLGFIVFGLISIIIATPLVLFPRRMQPKQPKPLNRRENSNSCLSASKDFLKSLLRLVTNSVYTLVLLSSCINLFAGAGLYAFYAKYMETQFFIPAWKANILLGAMNVIISAAGSIIGGLVVTKRKLSLLSCIKLIVVLQVLSILTAACGFVFGCSNADIAGFNMPSAHDGTNTSCGLSCGCDNTTYFPVCGSDNINYMSPCHAGCQKQDGMIFSDCDCVGNGGNATAGLCETSCNMLYPFVIASGVGALLSTLPLMPIFIVLIRSVSEADKPLAVGVSSFVTTLCGWFAGPVVFGIIVDTTCVIWSASCSGRGACALYDNDDLRLKKQAFRMIPQLIVLFIYVIVFIKARRKTDWAVEQQTKPITDENKEKPNNTNSPLSSPKSKPNPKLQSTDLPKYMNISDIDPLPYLGTVPL